MAGARRITRMGALRLVDEKSWEREIRQAMRAAGGKVGEAAKSLDISRRTLETWLSEDRFANVKRAAPGRPRNE